MTKKNAPKHKTAVILVRGQVLKIPRSMKSYRFIAFMAFTAVYVGWGSTYLAIVLALESFPPFFIGGSRFLLVGAGLYAYVRLRGVKAPNARQWADAFLVGGLLFFVGNGTVVWAEQFVPSGVVALLVATVPLFVAGLNALHVGKPSALTLGGIVLGLVGVGVLVNPWQEVGVVPILPGVLLLFSCFCWSLGSLYSRRTQSGSRLLSASMQMFAGGLLLMLASAFRGEPSSIDWAAVSMRSVAGIIYLGIVGSVVAYTAYIWLLSNVSPEQASTYAYVNPVVAVLLGYVFVGEPITRTMLTAGAIILVSVAMILLPRRLPKLSAAPQESELGEGGLPTQAHGILKRAVK